MPVYQLICDNNEKYLNTPKDVLIRIHELCKNILLNGDYSKIDDEHNFDDINRCILYCGYNDSINFFSNEGDCICLCCNKYNTTVGYLGSECCKNNIINKLK